MADKTIAQLPVAGLTTGDELVELQQGAEGVHDYAAPGGTFTAGLTLSGHRAVTISAGTVVYADRTVPGHARAVIGLTTGAAVNGTPVAVRFRGVVVEPSWTWTPDAPIWLGTTGLLTQTIPTVGFLRQIAYAVTATLIVVDPREPLALT